MFKNNSNKKSILESEIEAEKGEVTGTLTNIYNHDIRDVTNQLLHLQHHHTEISSTTHIHVDEYKCR